MQKLLFSGFATLFSTLSAANCPIGYSTFNNQCYLFSTKKLAWSQAEDFCESGNGFLTSVENGFEKSHLLGKHICVLKTYLPSVVQ